MKMKAVNANRILSLFAVLLLICGLHSICYAQDTPEVIQEEADPKLDLNDDGTINILDLVLVASSFGERGANDADVNDDGVVNILDLVLVASAFGKSVADPIDDTPESITYTTGDVIPTLPSHGRWFPSHSSNVKIVLAGNLIIIQLRPGGSFTYDGITYSSSSGCTIANNRVTSGTVSASSGAPDSGSEPDPESDPEPAVEGPSNTDVVDEPEPPADIVVGLVLPLSGHLAEIGERVKSGVDLALGELKGIRYIIADDKSTAEGAVAAFEELIHKHGVSVVLGPVTSSSAGAAFVIAQDNEVVAISPTAGARGLGAIGDFVFRIKLATDIVIPRGVEMTKRELGYQKVATLYDETDLFSTDRDAALQEAFIDNTVEVLDTQTFTTGTTDWTAQLTRIKALNPDALFVSALPPEKTAILIQARELGIDVPILISALTEIEVEAAGAAAEGALTFTGYLSTDNTPGNQAFVEKYKSTYGTMPSAHAAVSYACVHIFAEALNNAAATDAHSIRDALANISELDTIMGKFSFNADGDGVYKLNVLIVKNGTLRLFD